MKIYELITINILVILISIHVNAAGNGSKWLNATGWGVFTCSGQTESDRLAECLCEAAIKNFPGRRIRTDFSDGDSDWEEQFYILRKSWCPAVLTENFFMDNHSDLEYLQSRAGKQAVVDTHVEGMWSGYLCELKTRDDEVRIIRHPLLHELLICVVFYIPLNFRLICLAHRLSE